MAVASKALTIGVIIISLGLGFVFFYFFSPFPKQMKKKYNEELISQLINLVLFIWVGKILLNITTFIEDPLAILAYPGDSHSFYLAILFTALLVIYKTRNKSLDLFVFAKGFTYVFLASLFIYEFFQLVLEDDPFSIGYLILAATLLIIYYFIEDRVRTFVQLMVVLTGWTVGMLVLAYFYPFIALFGYLLDWGFIIAFFIFCLIIFILYERKGKLSWE